MNYLHLNKFGLKTFHKEKKLYEIIERINYLQQLIESNPDNYIYNYKDDRLDPETWKIVIFRELHYLKRWLYLRYKIFFNDKNQEKLQIFDQMLVLLPKNAITIHILRRVIPFMALGINVDVGFYPNTATTGINILRTITNILHLKEQLNYHDYTVNEKVKNFSNSKTTLVVCTGKPQTLELLREKYSGNLSGCTGNCSILICDNFNKADEISKSLISHKYVHSCTALKYKCVLIKNSNKLFASKASSYSYQPIQINEFIEKINPSVILSHIENTIPSEFLSYCIIDCDERGFINNQIGFAQDPKFGWPGDYLL